MTLSTRAWYRKLGSNEKREPIMPFFGFQGTIAMKLYSKTQVYEFGTSSTRLGLRYFPSTHATHKTDGLNRSGACASERHNGFFLEGNEENTYNANIALC